MKATRFRAPAALRPGTPRLAIWIVAVSILAAAVLGGCGGSGGGAGSPTGDPGGAAPGGDRPRVVTTLNIIGDLARWVAGDRADVHALLEPGVDPHVYEPVPQDSVAIARADLVFVNGLGLEGWVEKLVRAAGGDGTVVTLAGEEMDVLPWRDGSKRWDPHLWMDPRNAVRYVEKIRDALTEQDPAGADVYAANAAGLISEIEALDRWAESELGRIPADRRLLVTTHDAYQYFARRYGFTVLDTVWGVSTEDEPSAQDVAALVEVLRRNRVPPFIETTINPKIMEQVAAQAGVAIGGNLYGDSLGPPGSGADTYVTMMRHNVNTIVTAMLQTLGRDP